MSAQNDESYDSLACDAIDNRIRQVPVASLLPADSPRVNGEDKQHISMLAQLDTELPPILVQRGTMRVIDGMHRLRAAVSLGCTSIRVKFFDGTDAEAFVAGVRANSEHGLTLTLADREAAAARIVAMYPERSDRWTAAITGLAPGTVSAIRRRIPPGDELASRRIGRDGRVRPLDSAEGRRIAAQKIAEHPDASLREIARMAGISTGTVRDVRQRINRGEDVVPRKLPDKDSKKEPSGAGGDRESRRRAARVPETRDLLVLLTILQRDPSLRHSDNGRNLFRWLEAYARGPYGLVSQVESIPLHCAYLLAEFARSCANEWLLAARTLEQRVGDAAQ